MNSSRNKIRTHLKHTNYEKIGTNFHKWNLTEADHRLFKKTDWVVTEKIHGANFCILTDGKTIQYAKRTKKLAANEDFFGHSNLVENIKPKVLTIWTEIKAIYPNTKHISIYGELFGGEYPHPDVNPNLSVNAVQTGIYYSPNIEYLVFDIAYESAERHYLDYHLLVDICSKAGIMYSHALFIGKYEEAISYNIEFTTTIPILLNLPTLDIPNKAEGIVIKPAHSFVITTPKGNFRPVLKRKIAEFAEDKRFHQAQKWHYRTEKEKRKINIEDEILSLVTKARMHNVISKVGSLQKINKKKRRYILNLYVEDVLDSFQDNWDNLFDDLEYPEKERIREAIALQAAPFLDL